MTLEPKTVARALRHLKRRDPVMRDLIARMGPFGLKTQSNRFRVLARSIAAQQISSKAARAVRLRMEAAVAPKRFSPAAVAALSEQRLRQAGLSARKAQYIQGLARMELDGTLKLRSIARLSDEEVIERLTQAKGVGVWTAQMFLIFCLGRLDVFPDDDFGVRSAIRNLYGLDELPNQATCREIAEPWRPYASVASWYCWRSVDDPDGAGGKK